MFVFFFFFCFTAALFFAVFREAEDVCKQCKLLKTVAPRLYEST